MPAVQLFATCLGDLAFPDAVADAGSVQPIANTWVARSTSAGSIALGFPSGISRPSSRKPLRAATDNSACGSVPRNPCDVPFYIL